MAYQNWSWQSYSISLYATGRGSYNTVLPWIQQNPQYLSMMRYSIITLLNRPFCASSLSFDIKGVIIGAGQTPIPQIKGWLQLLVRNNSLEVAIWHLYEVRLSEDNFRIAPPASLNIVWGAQERCSWVGRGRWIWIIWPKGSSKRLSLLLLLDCDDAPDRTGLALYRSNPHCSILEDTWK